MPNSRFWDLLVWAAAAGLIGLGYMIGQGQGEEVNVFLQEKNSSQTKEIEKLYQTVSKLEKELSAKTSEFNRILDSLNVLTDEEVPDRYENDEENIVPAKRQIVTVDQGNSKTLFAEDLIITLIRTTYEGYPLRDRVYGSIGKRGKDNFQLNSADPGFSVIYEDYEVRILSTTTFTATFSATKLP